MGNASAYGVRIYSIIPDYADEVSIRVAIIPRFVGSLYCESFVKGIIAGIIEFTTYPFSVVKTRMQLEGELVRAYLPKRHRQKCALLTAIDIYNTEGIFCFRKGYTGAILRHGIYNNVRNTTFVAIREKVFKKRVDDPFPLWQVAICAFCAGTLGQFVASPLEIIKLHIQLENFRTIMGTPQSIKGFRGAIVGNFRNGGVMAFWHGAIPNGVRFGFVNLGYVTGFSVIKECFIKNTTMTDIKQINLISMFLSSFIAAGLGIPIDVIKSRLMADCLHPPNKRRYKNIRDCVSKTIANDGYRIMGRGLFPFWVRLAPWMLLFCPIG